MRNCFDSAILPALLLLASVWSAAGATLAITGDTGDYVLYETLIASDASGTALRCGASSATTPGGRNAIFVFALPVIGATNRVSSATLDFTYSSTSGSPAFNGDLWGVGFFSVNTGITSFFLKADADTNAANWKLHDNILVPSTPLGSVTSSNLADYLNSFYNANAGYSGGIYVYLRINPDANPGNAIVGYNLGSADSTNPPVLNVVTTYVDTPPAPTNIVATAGNGQVTLRWSAIAGATGYHLKKARFAGSPYTLIASLSATNFTDAGLVNGETCHYIVAAVNTNGEGAYSAEAVAIPSAPMTFVHPGMIHGQADLDRMRQMVAQRVEPWASAFAKLTNDASSKSSYTIAWQPGFRTATQSPAGNTNASQMNADANAAYQLALVWCINSNSACAQKAIQILNDWSSSLTNLNGSDAILLAGCDGGKFLNAAELLRYSNSGWAAADIAQFSAMMTNVFYPVIANFATFANGNWDACCEKTMADMGVFCDRPDLYQCATNYFYTGPGAGALTNYIYPNGQCQESGRDQQHTQFGIGELAELCEVAWHQGADLYGASSNRVLAGFEYTAKYNLGYSVPYTPANFTGWSNGIWFSTTVSTVGRGQLRPIYEMVYSHYVNRRGLAAPFTALVATNILAPEGGPSPGTEHPGFGTLTCSLLARTNWPARIEAETYSGLNGASAETCSEGGLDMCNISSNSYLRFASVNLANVQSFSARVSNGSANPTAIEIHLNSATGPLLGTCAVPTTRGGWQGWVTVSCNLMPTNIVANNLFLVFQGAPSGYLLNINWFSLNDFTVLPWPISTITTFLTGPMTPMDVGEQSGTTFFGGESVGNNAPATFPVGTNYVTWFSTNSSGYVTTQTQTVVIAGPPKITSVAAGQQFQISWPSLYSGWSLQMQTNNLASGLGANWTTIAGSDVTNQITIPVGTTNGCMLFRLVYP